MRNEIKKSLERLNYYEKLSIEKQEAWDADPFNPDREEAADAAYELEYNEFLHAAHLIQRFTDGQIELKQAMHLIKAKRADIIAII